MRQSEAGGQYSEARGRYVELDCPVRGCRAQDEDDDLRERRVREQQEGLPPRYHPLKYECVGNARDAEPPCTPVPGRPCTRSTGVSSG